jgi:hypothetical protein
MLSCDGSFRAVTVQVIFFVFHLFSCSCGFLGYNTCFDVVDFPALPVRGRVYGVIDLCARFLPPTLEISVPDP